VRATHRLMMSSLGRRARADSRSWERSSAPIGCVAGEGLVAVAARATGHQRGARTELHTPAMVRLCLAAAVGATPVSHPRRTRRQPLPTARQSPWGEEGRRMRRMLYGVHPPRKEDDAASIWMDCGPGLQTAGALAPHPPPPGRPRVPVPCAATHTYRASRNVADSFGRHLRARGSGA
jgi:hypothetical protein